MHDTYRAVQTQKMVKWLKFRIKKVERLHHLSSENKGTHQLRIIPTFHRSVIPLRSWQSWSFFKSFQIDPESNFDTSTLSVRFPYASDTFLFRFWRTCYESVALSLCFCGGRGFPKHFRYDPTTTMKIKLPVRLAYADGDAVATMSDRRLQFGGYVQLMSYKK